MTNKCHCRHHHNLLAAGVFFVLVPFHFCPLCFVVIVVVVVIVIVFVFVVVIIVLSCYSFAILLYNTTTVMIYDGTIIVPMGRVFSIKVVLRFVLAFCAVSLGLF